MELFPYFVIPLLIIVAASIILPFFFGAVWLPSPSAEVEGLLEAVGLKEGETFVDLGCGDGRTLLIAAKKFGAKAVGVEVDPLKALVAFFRAKISGLSEKVDIVWARAENADISRADVVFIYLSHEAIDRLKPKFESDLKKTARVVSYGFLIRGWPVKRIYKNGRGFIYQAGVGRKVDGIF